MPVDLFGGPTTVFHFQACGGPGILKKPVSLDDNTIRFLLYYPGHPAPELLRDAVRTLVERVDILHASFFSDSLGAHWHINNDLFPTSQITTGATARRRTTPHSRGLRGTVWKICLPGSSPCVSSGRVSWWVLLP